MEKTNYFYVLYCGDNTLYGGYTTDLERREQEHNDGVGAKYTRLAKRRPVKMIYAEAYNTRSQATKAEYWFKRKTRPEKERYLMNQGVDFNKLSTCIIIDRKSDADEQTE